MESRVTHPIAVRQEWWSRPGGAAEVLSVATPLIMSSLSWTMLTFVDRIFLSWWSEVSIAASFPANVMWWTSMCIPAGICMYVSTFVAQYHGAGQPRHIGPIVHQGLWVTLLSLPLVIVGHVSAPWIFSLGQHPPAVVAEEIAYFRILNVGAPAMMASFALSSLYSGRGRTWVVMLVDGFIAIVNAGLDYLFIFGTSALPAGGIDGAGWATVLSLWLKLAMLLGFVMRPTFRRQFRTDQIAWNGELMKRLLKFGFPSGLQMFLEVFGFAIFLLFVGRLGQDALAATNVAFSISTLAFMPIMSMGQTASILVGQHLGGDRPDVAECATWTTASLAIGYMLVVSAMYVLVPGLLVGAFFLSEANGSRQDIGALAAVLMRYVAAYNLFDAMNLVFSGAIKGAGDMRFVFVTSFWMAIVLVSTTWAALYWFQSGIHGCWTVVTLWVCVLGLVYAWRFRQGAWKTMRVIG